MELARSPRPDSLPENGIRPSRRAGAKAGRSIDWKAVCIAAIVAGVVSTLFQILLWWLAGAAPAAMLLRDARLAAAILMGTSVLPPPATFDPIVMLIASFVHFALSLAYSAGLGWVLSRMALRGMAALVAGGAYGAGIFALNMYGFTAVFPWFVSTRDWITLAAHVIFGLSLAQAYSLAKYDGWHADSASHKNKDEH